MRAGRGTEERWVRRTRGATANRAERAGKPEAYVCLRHPTENAYVHKIRINSQNAGNPLNVETPGFFRIIEVRGPQKNAKKLIFFFFMSQSL